MDAEASWERIRLLKQNLARFDELLLQVANDYAAALRFQDVIKPCPGLAPFETPDGVSNELLRHMDERSQIREELARALRAVRSQPRV